MGDTYSLPAVSRFIRERVYKLFGFIPLWTVEEEHRVYEDPRWRPSDEQEEIRD